ncbi:TCDD-inducible poly [ADP-ribose] polymerase [Triplophysa tibetana]|uniref:TCDD-inducible poly [ADP-ribose] polymerase n=1 Tax=Triplophysa tibetana TaxID=1572043 RepID=A0A5A9P153_9TELE|nr:TCDD-inducible poly [ADP-ribose] polymerase [Triplophysa tibetana]
MHASDNFLIFFPPLSQTTLRPSGAQSRGDWTSESYRARVLQQLRAAQTLSERRTGTLRSVEERFVNALICPVCDRSAEPPEQATGFDCSIRGSGTFYRMGLRRRGGQTRSRWDRINTGSTCELERTAIGNGHVSVELRFGTMQEAVETTEPALALPTETGEFAEHQMRLADKIPLVKPYFKKKHAQRKLDAKCLRALEDPILSTLLNSDALVSGDGVFVPRNQSRPQRNICTAAVEKQARISQVCLKEEDEEGAVSALMAVDSDADVTVSVLSVEQKVTAIQRVTIDANERRFQPQERDVAAPSSDVQGSKLNDIYTAETLQGANCLSIKEGSLKAEIFQDKSEEASLDLVFELLTQLQYHTHQEDGVSICVDFLQGVCVYGSDCAHHHTVLPYHWQIRRTDTQIWQSISDDSQEQLERLYCNPDNEHVRLKFPGRVFVLDFTSMRVCDLEFDLVRRLSTPSSSTDTPTNTSPTPSCLTVWKYYCRDNFGWREYSEPVVRLIEEASGRGLKEVRFITLQNQYILNIREGFQQNAVFGFRRQIKKRPLFRSSILLTPYLQTLGGLSSAFLTSLENSGNQPLSPAPVAPSRVYPETWLNMTTSQDFLQVPVSRDDRSYRTVYGLFHKTVSETKFRILKILRVQNPFLWEKYKRKKDYMSRHMSEMDRMLNERHLFHGTSQDVVEGICKHNFDPRVCGKHATMFGQGSYFARKAIYSHNFSKRSPRGVHYMFLAKVLTGKFTVGNPSMRRPPPLNPQNPSSDLFDSCVDNWMDPQIFVIFNDDQSYPYFIIQYEEVGNTVAI